MGLWKKLATQGALYGTETARQRKRRKKKARPKNPAPVIRAKKKPPIIGDFYTSREWQDMRYKALVLHGAQCQCCGATRRDGVKLHVDHIKPRSKFPELELSLDNLQVLCEPCNMGKSNKDATDWR